MSLPVDMGGNDLYVNNIYTGSTAPGQLVQGGEEVAGTSITTSTATLTSAQSGTTIVLNRAAGSTVTLPTPIVGMDFTFVIGTALTSNAYKIITSAGTVFISGGLYFDKALTITRYDGNTSTIVSINLNGTTTGGATVGDTFNLVAVSPTQWAVEGTVTASGTLATPFATS